MANIKKETFGTLSDGRETFIYTLRNNKGNELKVTDFGARIVSLRFRDKNFANKFVVKTFANVGECENNFDAGIVLVDDSADFAKIVWQSEEVQEGVKLSAEIENKKVQVIYGISNDNELSIKYEGENISDISTQMFFDSAVLPDTEITPFAEGAEKTKLVGQKIYNIIDKPAEVEFVEGMFGYDFGCPIDYFDAGLKNAADIFSDSAKILLQVYATQNKLQVAEVEGGFAIKTSDTKLTDNKIKSQTVYILKNRK